MRSTISGTARNLPARHRLPLCRLPAQDRSATERCPVEQSVGEPGGDEQAGRAVQRAPAFVAAKDPSELAVPDGLVGVMFAHGRRIICARRTGLCTFAYIHRPFYWVSLRLAALLVKLEMATVLSLNESTTLS